MHQICDILLFGINLIDNLWNEYGHLFTISYLETAKALMLLLPWFSKKGPLYLMVFLSALWNGSGLLPLDVKYIDVPGSNGRDEKESKSKMTRQMFSNIFYKVQ